MRSLLRCHGCRLTWFPQGGATSACPACGGTKLGGTLELFHFGVALISLGLTGWFLRHGPLGELRPPPAVPTVIQGSAQPVAVAQRPASAPVYVSSTPARVKPAAVKRTAAVKPGVKVSKLKASTAKRRPKKASKRSKHVQR
jgi:hypothetical protein